MEIERKFLIKKLPEDIQEFPHKEFEQGYLNTSPVVRVRREQDDYVLTYKGGGLLVRDEYNLPLDKASFNRLISKAEGHIIRKSRYFIPEKDELTIELDIFKGELSPLVMAEVEFESEEQAKAYIPPDWFGTEVTYDSGFHNSNMSKYGLPSSFLGNAHCLVKEEFRGLCDTVSYDDKESSLVIIDQTLLPGEIKLLSLTETEDIREAIYRLQVRGAPAIGVAAAIGLYVVASRSGETEIEAFRGFVKNTAERINSARPTAVNLSWALKRMIKRMDEAENQGVDTKDGLLEVLRAEALAIREEDIAVCQALGRYGNELIHNGSGILTHCNAGHLATVRLGTATAPMYTAHSEGKNIRVYCDETRPLLQGARLTAFELSEAGIDTTLICDNMSASLMKSGAVDLILVGADRIAANGDAANKIGTSLLATAAKRYGIPFYVVAPISTIDVDTLCGDDIEIEQRDPAEVTELWYKKRVAPDDIKVYNPAFDVTDHELISGIITEKGILRAPYESSIAECVGKEG